MIGRLTCRGSERVENYSDAKDGQRYSEISYAVDVVIGNTLAERI